MLKGYVNLKNVSYFAVEKLRNKYKYCFIIVVKLEFKFFKLCGLFFFFGWISSHLSWTESMASGFSSGPKLLFCFGPAA